MAKNERPATPIAMLVLVLSVTVIPACQGAGWFQLHRRPDRQAARPTAIPYSAYRPAYGAPPKRTLFLGGYAGYNYNSNLRGPVNYVPTSFGVQSWGYPAPEHGLGWHKR